MCIDTVKWGSFNVRHKWDVCGDYVRIIIVIVVFIAVTICELYHECASTSDLITRTRFYFRDKTRVQMFFI